MADRQTSVDIIFNSRLDAARAEWEKFRDEVTKNPLRVQIEAANARLAGATGPQTPGTFGNAGGVPFVSTGTPAAQTAVAQSPNLINIRQAAHAQAQANAAMGVGLAGVGGVRTAGPNTVYAGDMSAWLAQARVMPQALTAPAVIAKAVVDATDQRRGRIESTIRQFEESRDAATAVERPVIDASLTRLRGQLATVIPALPAAGPLTDARVLRETMAKHVAESGKLFQATMLAGATQGAHEAYRTAAAQVGDTQARLAKVREAMTPEQRRMEQVERISPPLVPQLLRPTSVQIIPQQPALRAVTPAGPTPPVPLRPQPTIQVVPPIPARAAAVLAAPTPHPAPIIPPQSLRQTPIHPAQQPPTRAVVMPGGPTPPATPPVHPTPQVAPQRPQVVVPQLAQWAGGSTVSPVGYMATVPGQPIVPVQPGRSQSQRQQLGEFSRFARTTGIAYFGTQAITDAFQAGNRYSMEMAEARSGFDAARASTNYYDNMFGAIPLAGPLGVAMSEAFTGDRARLANQTRSAQLGESVGDAVLGATRQRALSDIGIRQSALSGVGLRFQAERAGIELGRRAAEFAAQAQYDPQIAALAAEKSAIVVPQVMAPIKPVGPIQSVLFPAGAIAWAPAGPDTASPEYARTVALDSQIKQLQAARDRAIEQGVKVADSLTKTLGISLDISTRQAKLGTEFRNYERDLVPMQVRLDAAEMAVREATTPEARTAAEAERTNARQSITEFKAITAREAAINVLQGRAGVAQLGGQVEGFSLVQTLEAIRLDKAAQLAAIPVGGPGETAMRRIVEERARLQAAQAVVGEQQQIFGVRAFVESAQLRMQGNPIGAQLAQIRGEFQQATAGKLPDSPEFIRAAQIRDASFSEARFNFQYARAQTDIGLRGEAMAIGRQLQRDPVGAQAFATAAAGAQRIRDLQRNFPSAATRALGESGFGGGVFGNIIRGLAPDAFASPQAEQARQNTLGELARQKQEYLLGFRAQQIDAFNIMPFTTRNSQNPQDVLNAIDEAVGQVQGANMQGGARGGGQVGITEESIGKIADQLAEAVKTSLQSLLNFGQ